eukprot:CAMPEP_0118932936 /NCGR_PEP_ID=MMETSP1169-20130426/10721_1 /TAXON_ID=36882 /ORGANISM="Pyramimonas obovata, Strain CCMP722" /LENGTH=177 /DNA_ID=CAMNT_0006875643 /DNA_START=174 /DNA_END=708 /DNA_ORIENTATION=+
MVLGVGLSNSAMQANRDAYLRNKDVKTGAVRLDRRSGSGRNAYSKKQGAGGKGTWGAWDQYDMDMDMNDDFEEDEDTDEYKAPAYAWMMADYAALTDSPKVADQPAPQTDILKMLNDLIKEFSENQRTNPKLPKKAQKYADKNNKMCRALSGTREFSRGMASASRSPAPRVAAIDDH